MRKLVVLGLSALAALALAAPAFSTHIIRPDADTQVESYPAVRVLRVHPNPNTGCISLELWIRGWKMYPQWVGSSTIVRGGGHYHLYVNGKYYNFGSNAKSARACGLETGRSYRLQVVLAHNNHSEIAARSQVVTAVLR
jgi:hypothetical protein